MSFWSAFKSFFGFGPSADGADSALYADGTDPAEDTKQQAALPDPQPVEIDPARRDAIFAQVLEVFNQSLPDFLKRSVDPEAQRRALIDSLDTGLREYIDSISESVKNYHEAVWNRRQADMAGEMAEIRRRSDEVEQRANGLKEKQLSADRQKRALIERLHDMEQQCASLQAEREQFELENRSLMSRLKAGAVQAEDLETLRTQVDDLRKQLDEAYNRPDSALARVRDTLNNELEKAREGNDTLKEQMRVSAEMLEDMRRRHAESAATVKERESRIAALEEQIASDTRSHKDSRRAADKKIATLESELTDRSAQIETLKATIAENLRLQALREEELQREIDSLRPPTVVSEMSIDFGTPQDSSPRISDDDITALKESFETDDWFTASPPPDTPSMRPPKDSIEFGYSAPAKRKPQPENPAQLSLF